VSLRLTDIQRFCVHDGPGIRTTLFTKGCGIRCPWCSNPENLNFEIEKDKEGNTYGKNWEIEEIIEICLKDKNYYGNTGGVTVSGGEALWQCDQLTELFKGLHKHDISCCIETALFVPKRNLECMLKYTDLWYVDMKIIDKCDALTKINADADLYDSNLKLLFENVNPDKIVIRIPIVRGYTYTEDNIKLIINKIKEYSPERCEIFAVHNLGEAKYKKMGILYNPFETVSNDELEKLSAQLQVVNADMKVVVIA